MNCGNRKTELLMRAYGEDGSLLETYGQRLRPNQNMVGVIYDIFSTRADKIKSVEISTEDGVSVCGFYLYGTTDGNRLSGQSLASPASLPLYAPFFGFDAESEWTMGVGLTNFKDAPAELRIVLLDDGGGIVSQRPITLAPHQHYADLITNIFGQNLSGRYVKIEAEAEDSRVGAVYILGTWDGTKLIGVNFGPQ